MYLIKYLPLRIALSIMLSKVTAARSRTDNTVRYEEAFPAYETSWVDMLNNLSLCQNAPNTPHLPPSVTSMSFTITLWI